MFLRIYYCPRFDFPPDRSIDLRVSRFIEVNLWSSRGGEAGVVKVQLIDSLRPWAVGSVQSVLTVTLSLHTLTGRAVGAVGLPGPDIGSVEDPHGDDEDDADQHHGHHHAAAQHQQSPELLLKKYPVKKTFLQQISPG